jgi:hypothetical protein
MAKKQKKLLDRVREIIRLKQYSNKTGKACFFNMLVTSSDVGITYYEMTQN